MRPRNLCWPAVNSLKFVGAVSSSPGAICCAQTGMYRNIKEGKQYMKKENIIVKYKKLKKIGTEENFFFSPISQSTLPV